jgi:hypothetical protein
MSQAATRAGTRRRRAMDELAIERAIARVLPKAPRRLRRGRARELYRDRVLRSGAGRTLRVGGVKVR